MRFSLQFSKTSIFSNRSRISKETFHRPHDSQSTPTGDGYDVMPRSSKSTSPSCATSENFHALAVYLALESATTSELAAFVSPLFSSYTVVPRVYGSGWSLESRARRPPASRFRPELRVHWHDLGSGQTSEEANQGGRSVEIDRSSRRVQRRKINHPARDFQSSAEWFQRRSFESSYLNLQLELPSFLIFYQFSFLVNRPQVLSESKYTQCIALSSHLCTFATASQKDTALYEQINRAALFIMHVQRKLWLGPRKM